MRPPSWMDDLTTELISRYADGEVSAEERRQVEDLLGSDPAAQALLADFEDLSELFAPTAPEEVSAGLKARLYGLGRIEALERFEPVTVQPAPRRWTARWAALAAAVLLVVGLVQLTYRPPLVVKHFTRQVVGAHGRVLKTERLGTVRMRAGDTLRSRTGERVSAWVDGCLVVLIGDSEITLGDPRDHDVFEVERGTALCTIGAQKNARTVHAAEYEIRADAAYFGVRVRPAGARSAGAAAGSEPEVTVAVNRGSLTVTDNGMNETVVAGDSVTFVDGSAVTRAPAWRDPLYVHMMRHFRVSSREILPGYFEGEQGVMPVSESLWSRGEDGSRVLVLTRREGMELAHYLVLYVRASKPGPLQLTRVRPYRDRRDLAETTTVETAEVGTDWTVIAVPRDAFDKEGVKRQDRKIPAGRSTLMRLELRPAVTDITLELKASLWAVRPPADHSEAVR